MPDQSTFQRIRDFLLLAVRKVEVYARVEIVEPSPAKTLSLVLRIFQKVNPLESAFA